MSKTFEITYRAPFGGLHVQAPENLLDPKYSPSFNDFILRNNELRTRPHLTKLIPSPNAAPGSIDPAGSIVSFLSVNSVWHTMYLNNVAQYQLNANWQGSATPWTQLSTITTQVVPFAAKAYQGIIYFTNGTHLSCWDGIAAACLQDVAFLGTPPLNVNTGTYFGSFFLTELDSHLLMAFTRETVNSTSSYYPQRVRWSSVGFYPGSTGTGQASLGANINTGAVPATFDPTLNANAGFVDMTDTPDIITGLMALGRVGYVFRQNGITEVVPTGNGYAPFDFNHLWAADRGIGNVFPYSIAQYGSFGVFISQEQIYQISPSSFTEIGGGARDAILRDLAQAVSTPVAAITPIYNLGYTYLTYHLFISQPGGVLVSLVYSFEDKNWMRMTYGPSLTDLGLPKICWV